MAKYQIEHECGHTQTHDIIGRGKDRESKIAWLGRGVCRDCFLEKIEQERREAAAKAALDAQELGLPELLGSEKQLQWATQLRAEFLTPFEVELEENSYGASHPALQLENEFCGNDVQSRAFHRAADQNEKNLRSHSVRLQTVEGIKNVVFAFAASKTSAHWWIDNRYNLKGEFIKARREVIGAVFVAAMEGKSEAQVLEAQRHAEAQKAAQIAAHKAALEEATLYPKDAQTKFAAEVRLEEKAVVVNTPYGVPIANEVVKKLGYHLDRPIWRLCTRVAGDTRDRAAHVVNLLLEAGVPVRCQDAEVREMAASGQFAPPIGRYITTFKADHASYPGWFYIHWPKDDNFYSEAKRIKGARYAKPAVAIPPVQWETIADFAQRNDCKILAPAQKLIEAQRAAETARLTVEVVPAPPSLEPAPTLGAVPRRLAVPETVEVAADLKDDENGEVN